LRVLRRNAYRRVKWFEQKVQRKMKDLFMFNTLSLQALYFSRQSKESDFVIYLFSNEQWPTERNGN
jgi:hypothetical protein